MPAVRRCRRCALRLAADLSGGHRALPLDCLSCQKTLSPFDEVHAAVPYAFPWSGLISQYKFSEHSGWAALLAGLMLRSPAAVSSLRGMTANDLVVPMPLTGQRLGQRGFNQSWTLAQALVRHSGTPAQASATLLLRIKHTLPQSELPLAQRLRNVQGAFAVDPLQVSRAEGRHIALVDDVMTSGASVLAAAQALREAGARRVTVFVVARTEA